MLLNLDDSLLEIDNTLKERVVVCITNILIGFYEANFLVQASDEIYEFFEPLIDEDRASRSLFYLKVNNSYAYDIEPFNIVYKDRKEVDVSNREISIFFFEKTISIQKAIILGENGNDVRYYTFMASILFPQIPISFDIMSGGGSTTSEVFDNIQKQNKRFCLVIADSDMKYPDAPLGGTAKAIEKVWNKKRAHLDVYRLSVHEAENLLPLSFVKEKAKNNKNAIDFLKRIEKTDSFNSIWRCYDIKEGIKVEDIELSPDYYSFAKKVYLEVYGVKQSFEKYISQLKFCKRKHVMPPIRSDVLDKFVHLKDEEKVKYSIFLYQQECEEIAKRVVRFACCRPNDDPLNI